MFFFLVACVSTSDSFSDSAFFDSFLLETGDTVETGRSDMVETGDTVETGDSDETSSAVVLPEQAPQNLLVLVFDAARHDEMTSHEVMPYFSGLDGVWTFAQGQGNWTRGALPPTFTGMYGPSLGPDLYAADSVPQVPVDVFTLGELLTDAKFASYADICNEVVTGAEVTRGFGEVYACGWNDTAVEQFQRTQVWIASQPVDTRWVAYVHLMEPHDLHRDQAPECADAAAAQDELCTSADVLNGGLEGMSGVTQDERDECALAAKMVHECDVVQMDHYVESAMADLEAAGMLDNTLVAVVNDHGDNEGEQHGNDTYGNALPVTYAHHREAYMQVSGAEMFFSWPGAANVVLDNVAVGQVDFVPTILEGLGIEAPTTLDGLSLFGGIPEDRVVSSFSCDSETQHHVAWDGRSHAIRKLYRDGSPNEFEVVYDHATDPLEVNPSYEIPENLLEVLDSQQQQTSFEVYCVD